MIHLTLHLDVDHCPGCGGDHPAVPFVPRQGPHAGETHWGVCPSTGRGWHLNTRGVIADDGRPVWDHYLEAAQAPPEARVDRPWLRWLKALLVRWGLYWGK